MSRWNEENSFYKNDNIENEKQIEENIKISKLLYWLLTKDDAEIYIWLYNNQNEISKTKILNIIDYWIESLNKWLYSWKLDKKEAWAILLKYAIDLIRTINNYKFYNQNDITTWRSIVAKYSILIGRYPLIKKAFTKEEEEEIIKMWKYTEEEQKK